MSADVVEPRGGKDSQGGVYHQVYQAASRQPLALGLFRLQVEHRLLMCYLFSIFYELPYYFVHDRPRFNYLLPN